MTAILDPRLYRARENAPVLYSGGSPPYANFDDSGSGGSGDDDDHDDDSKQPAGWVTVAAFWYPAQAHIARLRLEASGIACVLVGEIAAATHLLNIATGGVKLQVPRAQYPRAARLLRKQHRDGLPEARVALADFERLLHAKAAACVVESAGLWCEIIERRDFAATPTWARWLPRAIRARLWPAATVVVERDALRAAVGALLSTPFVHGLTPSARLARPDQHCRVCEAPAQWAFWHLVWPAASSGTPLRAMLPRLARKCGRCGQEWPAPPFSRGCSGSAPPPVA